ncbi:uncharacterized protein J3D65DRAFT_615354 [Phyllosticta citribraziliensis]|uniref:Letm1 RBD domain-containing protein n=1 Tax=Phyllosticta citribraziliensis TaxID=989973 RepID=A0ABR1LZ02_9PEZI
MSTLLRTGRPARICRISPWLQPTRRLSDRVERVDRVNPPASTLPAPVKLPAKDENESKVKYWFEFGKAYLSFFKTGVKNVWANSKVARELRKTKEDDLTRADFQLIARSRHDMTRLPIFAVVFIVCGEFTLLVAPFMAGVMPKTCRPPQIEEGLLRRAETQRQIAEQRWQAVVDSLPPSLKPLARRRPSELLERGRNLVGAGEDGAVILTRTANALSFQMACMYDLYTKPMFKIREKSTQWGPLSQAIAVWMFSKREHRRVTKHYSYLIRDSELLVRDGGTQALNSRELRVACAERGINVLDRSEEELRHDLNRWLSADAKKRDQMMREAMPEMKEELDQLTEVQKAMRR